MVSLDLTLGALEVGTLLSIFLYGLITVQVYIYSQAGFKDNVAIRFLVVAMWVMDTVHTIFLGIFLYHLTVTEYGQPSSLNEIHWSYVGVLLLNGIMAVAVQSFFAYRIRVISGRLLISILSWSICLVRLGMTLTVGILSNDTWIFTDYLRKYEWTIPTALSILACGDVLNTSALCFYLTARRTGFAPTNQVINKLIIWAIETGLITTVCGIVVLVLSVVMPGSLTWVGIYFFFPKFYAISMLTSLNNRSTLRRVGVDSDDSTSAMTMQFVLSQRESTTHTKTCQCQAASLAIHKNAQIERHSDDSDDILVIA